MFFCEKEREKHKKCQRCLLGLDIFKDCPHLLSKSKKATVYATSLLLEIKMGGSYATVVRGSTSRKCFG